MSYHLLYLHGFNSSPLSIKAEQSRQFFAKYYPDVTFYCPQIVSNPRDAIQQLTQLVEQNTNAKWLLMGSSLGGYLASYLSERYQLLAVLINPAVKPYELLVDYIGEQVNPYTKEVYQVTAQYMDALKAIEQEKITEKNYQVMVQTGDEVLDYRQATQKYQHCQLIVQQGGDHSFVNFNEMLPDIANFLLR